jgi:UDP-N-acetylglucosamine 2-epimerase (non-hydrolysing)
MCHNQTLSDVASKILSKISKVFIEEDPDLVLVHGDTTTAMSAALAAFHLKIPIGHVEAGLRTNDIESPFPEEMNRQVISRISRLHFSPTDSARKNLQQENIVGSSIFVTGNTTIDSLLEIAGSIKKIDYPSNILERLPFLSDKDPSLKIILVTGHRRENIGEGFKRIFTALLQIAKQNPTVKVIYPVHLNPNVQRIAQGILSGIDNIFLINPVDYKFFVKLMSDAYLILTDSGGIQEEAPSLGKPVLVLRESTERNEAIVSNTAILVGTDTEKILNTVNLLLSDTGLYNKMSNSLNPYGDGKSAKRIHKIIKEFL